MTIVPAFAPLFHQRSRYAVLYGGSGSGKSWAVAQKLVFRCLHEPDAQHRFLALRKFGTSVKNSIFQQIKTVLITSEILESVKINLTDQSFTFPNGNMIVCSGLDDPEKIKSAIFTGFWLEEATDFDLEDFQQIDLRLRGDHPAYKQIILSFNPISETHWIKSQLFDAPQEDVWIHHSTYLDNTEIDADYKRLLEERMVHDENLYRIYVKGEWGHIRTGMEFYSSFNYAKHVKHTEYLSDFPILASFDQNVVPYCTATLYQVLRDGERYKIRQFDEIIMSNPRNKTEEVCREILYRYPDMQSFYYFGDATGKKRDTRGMENDYDIIDRVMQRYITNRSNNVPAVNPPVSKRRDFINRLLAGVYPIDFQIDPRCKISIADFETVKEGPDRAKLKTKKKDPDSGVSYEDVGHASDCADYFFCENFRSFFDK